MNAKGIYHMKYKKGSNFFLFSEPVQKMEKANTKAKCS